MFRSLFLSHALACLPVPAQALFFRFAEADPAAARHAEALAEAAAALAEQSGHFGRRALLRLVQAALLHDVGRLVLPGRADERELLTPDLAAGTRSGAPGADQELARLLVAERLLGAALGPETALLPIVRAVGERWDGSGRPDGLSGRSIPELARVLAVGRAWTRGGRATVAAGIGGPLDPYWGALAARLRPAAHCA